MRPVRHFCSAISMASRVEFSFASNVFLFVPKYVFYVIHLMWHHTTLSPLRPKSSLEPTVQKNISPGRSVCILASFAPSFLSLAKRAIFPGKFSSYTPLVCFVPAVVLMLVLSESVLASRCSRVSLLLQMGLNQLWSQLPTPRLCLLLHLAQCNLKDVPYGL